MDTAHKTYIHSHTTSSFWRFGVRLAYNKTINWIIWSWVSKVRKQSRINKIARKAKSKFINLKLISTAQTGGWRIADCNLPLYLMPRRWNIIVQNLVNFIDSILTIQFHGFNFNDSTNFQFQMKQISGISQACQHSEAAKFETIKHKTDQWVFTLCSSAWSSKVWTYIGPINGSQSYKSDIITLQHWITVAPRFYTKYNFFASFLFFKFFFFFSFLDFEINIYKYWESRHNTLYRQKNMEVAL